MLRQLLLKFGKAFKNMDGGEVEEMSDDERRAIERNEYWKERLQWDFPTVVKQIGAKDVTCVDCREFVHSVKDWQKRKGLTVDGIVGPKTWEVIEKSSLSPRERAVNHIVQQTIVKESGGNYSAMNKDGEFRGLFDNHRAEGKIHIGLSFGLFQFTQDSGQLGKFLKKCAEINEERFKSVMGPTWDQLLIVTNKPGPSGFATGERRGPRVKKVEVDIDAKGTRGLRDLWEEPWTDKFRRLGQIPEFQLAQRELAEQDYLIPILSRLKNNHLRSEKMVAAGFSGAIHRGVGGMSNFLRGCINSVEVVDDRSVLNEMVGRDSRRFKSFLEDDNLSWEEWEGWRYY